MKESTIKAVVDVVQDALFIDQFAAAWTCSEADVFADLLREAGKDAVADDLISAHRVSDEQGDAHFIDWSAKVTAAIQGCHGATWDGCHKIYITLDEASTLEMEQIGYVFCKVEEYSVQELADMVKTWYSTSCGLKFIDTVATNDRGPGEEFEGIIPQGERAVL